MAALDRRYRGECLLRAAAGSILATHIEEWICMAKATTCRYAGDVISIAEALDLRIIARRTRKSLAFSCVECGGAVRAHAAAKTGMAAHFEHRSWREADAAKCSLRQLRADGWDIRR